MNLEVFANALVLSGPTGSGKTRLGIEIAERLQAEIVSMDSMALYRGMDIGTAKPGVEERRRVRHHLIDVLDPWESASVAWWLEQAVACCRDIEGRGKRVLFVGGTPLYLKALLRGLFKGPPGDSELRRRLLQEADQHGCHQLHQRLAAVDPVSAGRVHPNDVRRIIRALEVWQLTGQPMSAWQQQWDQSRGSRIEDRGSPDDQRPGKNKDPQPQYDRNSSRNLDSQSSILDPPSSILERCVWLDIPRAELYRVIDARVQNMVETGLVEEVRKLRNLPRPLSKEAAQALGYKEMFDYLDGRASLEETIVHIQTRSRNFAKRQISWLRHLPECRPLSSQLTINLWGLTIKLEQSRI
jgi:tRNA dimethylallyltransferase